MQPAANDTAPQEALITPPDWPADPRIEAREHRNLLLLAAHQIVFRIGWIFKTESVIMPFFIDRVVTGWVGGPVAGALRGCLPVLNRLGQSVPPVFCAERLKATRQKKLALAGFVLLMSLPFAVLSLVWFAVGGRGRLWVAGLFLGLYFTFFVFNGLYQVSFGTVQGKLIRPTRRGRLLLVSTALGTIPAMLFAWWLLRGWLELAGGFGYIFGFTAVCFFLSGLTPLLLFEPADDPPRREPRIREDPADTWDALRGKLAGAWHALGRSLAETGDVLRGDRNLRRLALVAMLFGSALIIFPHYQTLARHRFGLSREQAAWYLMIWVVVQNAAVGLCSLFVGPLADVWGNRLTLRTLIFGSAVGPPLAVFLSHWGGSGLGFFWTVFIALGFTPLVLRIAINYTLETCRPAAHPRYLSTVYLCLAMPFVFSPLVGWLVAEVDFDLVFLAVAGLLVLGGFVTFRLDEPRHRVPGDRAGAINPGGQE